VNGTRDVALVGIVAALSVALDLVAWPMPNGGKISLAWVPVLLLELQRGGVVGMWAGAIAGFLHYFLQYQAVTPVSLLLDYPVAGACLGVAGFLRTPNHYSMRRNALAVALAVTLKYSVHVVSGVIFYSQGLSTATAWQVSATYIATYMLPQLVINLALVPPLALRVATARRSE